jgi:hypothetical protein
MELRALLIAASTYQSTDLPDIPSAVNDLGALADALAGPEADQSDVKTLQNPGLREVRRALSEALATASPDTTLVVHFACHGIVDQEGRSFLALADTDPESPTATALDTELMMDLIGHGNARSVVLLLDTCLSSRGSADRLANPGVHHTSAGTSTALIRSTYSRPLASERHSLFTQALIDALHSDDADPDGDGLVKVKDLYDHVRRSLGEAGDRELSYVGSGPATLPRAWWRGRIAELAIERTLQRSELGAGAYRLTWGTALDGFIAVEVHPDQYSLNWHTPLTGPEFAKLCRRSHESQVLIETTSGAQQVLSGLDAWWLASRGELGADVQLVRYWLRDSSVAWQRLHPDGPSIVGVASDTVDVSAIARLVRRTATTAVLEREQELMRMVETLDGQRFASLADLREVLGRE